MSAISVLSILVTIIDKQQAAAVKSESVKLVDDCGKIMQLLNDDWDVVD